MESRNLTELISGVFKPVAEVDADTLAKKMEKLAAKNEQDINKIVTAGDLVNVNRVPTAAELLEMRQWAIDYKKNNPSVSKRQLRKATQSHFNIRIYRASYKKKS